MAIHLIPCPISENGMDQIPPETRSILHKINHFVVERSKTSRRYIKESEHPTPQNELVIFELNKHKPEEGLADFLARYSSDFDIGILSEAGCPGIADPGSRAVTWAHRNGIKVIPHIGPSSILMALMASGMNGQSFVFHGYLPNKNPGLAQQLKQLESAANKHKQSQIFIETPYRNGFLLTNCIAVLSNKTRLSISVDLGSPTEENICKSIGEWKNAEADGLHKRPAVFVIG